MLLSSLTLVRCPNVALFGELLIAEAALTTARADDGFGWKSSAEISRRL